MSRILNFYTKDKDGNDVDRTWYDSSTIKYSECLDADNALKTLKVVFNNATQYEYKNIKVQDYLMFRDSASAGKGLNQFIKANGYEYEKLENADLATLDGELTFRSNGGIFLYYDGDTFTMKDNKDKVIVDKKVKLTKDAFNTICAALVATGKEIYTEGDKFVDENNEEYTSNTEEAPF